MHANETPITGKDGLTETWLTLPPENTKNQTK